MTDLAVQVVADPRPRKRFRASYEEWTALREKKLVGAACRLGGTDPGPLQLHHICPRGVGGDDMADNLVPLSPLMHELVTNRDPWARSLLGQRLTVAERAYVVGRKGAGWLDRNYGVKAAA